MHYYIDFIIYQIIRPENVCPQISWYDTLDKRPLGQALHPSEPATSPGNGLEGVPGC